MPNRAGLKLIIGAYIALIAAGFGVVKACASMSVDDVASDGGTAGAAGSDEADSGDDTDAGR